MKRKIFSTLFALVLAVSLMLVPATLTGASPGPGLVGLWHLDKVDTSVTPNTTPDSSELGNTGSLYPIGSEPTLVPGMFGKALKFDGVNDYVEAPDSATLRLTSDMTVEAWVYISALASDWVRVVGKGDTTYRNYGLWYHGPSGKVLFQIYEEPGAGVANAGTTWGTVVNALTVSTEAWYHFAGVKEGSTIYLYLDSVLVASAPITFTPATSSDPLRLGYAGFHSRHNGMIDEVRIWDEALTAGQIALSYSGSVNWLPPVTNADFTLKDGTTLPLKFQVFDDSGLVTTEQSVSLEVTGPEGFTGQDLYMLGEGVENLRWDAVEFHYIANLKTKDGVWPTGPYTATVGGIVTGIIPFDLSAEKGTGRGNSGK